MVNQPLDIIPIWALYFVTVIAMLLSMEAGYRINRALRRKSPDATDAGLGGMVGASLGLLAFLLAFVVGYGANINTERRQLVVDEANAIGTTFLRAGYLDEVYRTEARELLREYTDIRIQGALERSQLYVVTRSEEIHNILWASAEQIAIKSPLPTTSLYISSLNEVIDRHAERVAVGAYIRVPPSIVLGLYVVALFTFFLVGVQSGDGEKRNYFAHIVLALILSVVFILIVDLDREQEGLLQVSQQPMLDLLRQLNP
jgi:hypothetical protein